ncbi:MAG TPA: DUF669 domain-containing protein [Phycisphaerae bacterium]|nr:DUF669 domain-containing protein [Phycisphaerae bacterium]
MTDSGTPFDPQTPSPYAAPPDLSAFDDEYGTVQPADSDEVPDGKYQARVHAVKLDRSQKGDPMLKWDLIVLSGQHTGRHIFKNAVITQASLPFVKGDLKTLGLELPKLSELPNHLDQLLDHALEVTKRTKGEYTNVYFNKRIQVPAGEAAPCGGVPF